MSFGFRSLSSPCVSNDPSGSFDAPRQVSEKVQLRWSELCKLRADFIKTHGLADLFKSNVSEETASVLQQRLYHLTNIRTEQSSTLKAFKRTIPPIVHPLTIFEEIVQEITICLEIESNFEGNADKNETVGRQLLSRAEFLLYLSREDQALSDYEQVKERFPPLQVFAENGILMCKKRFAVRD